MTPTIINIKNKKDLITVDLRTKQIRYLINPDKHGAIKFINLSRDDVDGYSYLYANDKKLFLKTIKEDLMSFMGINVRLIDLKEVIK
jgi:hypothetical protein